MEVFQDVTLHVVLNLNNPEWDSPFESIQYSNYLALFFVCTISLVPPCLMLLYCCKINKLKDQAFNKKYGALLLDSNLDHGIRKYNIKLDDDEEVAVWYQPKWMKIIPIIYGMTFFIRRITFIITVLFLNEYLLT